LADINSGRGDEIIAKLEDPGRFSSAKVDARSKTDIVALAQRVKADVIVNACDPRLNESIFEAAFEAGCTYLDMAMNLSKPHPTNPYEEVGEPLGKDQISSDERWKEKGIKLSILWLARRKGGGLRQDGAKATGRVIRPPQQRNSKNDQQRRFDLQQNANGVNSPVNNIHIDAPEKYEARELRQSNAQSGRPCWINQSREKCGADLKYRLATNPSLNAKPTARNQRA
jgi:hypothetical protein